LTISTNTQARELLFEGTRCVGVKASVDGREQEFRGREIISPAARSIRRRICCAPHRPGRPSQGLGNSC